jgi:hypothetical protein
MDMKIFFIFKYIFEIFQLNKNLNDNKCVFNGYFNIKTTRTKKSRCFNTKTACILRKKNIRKIFRHKKEQQAS